MITLNISKADIVTANYERIHNPIPRIRERMDAIYWVSQGCSRAEIAETSHVHRNSVVNYIKLYNDGGLKALKTFKYKGFDSVLKGHRITLEQYFKEHPPRTGKEATAKVKELTGTQLNVDEVRRFMRLSFFRSRPIQKPDSSGRRDVITSGVTINCYRTSFSTCKTYWTYSFRLNTTFWPFKSLKYRRPMFFLN